MSPLLLGIDLGTTSVKTVLIDSADGRIILECNLESQASIDVSNPLKNEQNVSQIFSTVDKILEKFPGDLMARVVYIGISGQMHGVLLWKSSEAWSWRERAFEVQKSAVSSLVTWQDSRCDLEFLATLPVPDSHLGVHTGFGIPTLFWLQRKEHHRLEGFDCAGTIHDFLVSALINNKSNVYMTPQNAASWGYFNTVSGDWNREILERAKFPVELLPEIREAGTVAGNLCNGWHGIPSGCKIGMALGDLQASIYSTLYAKPEPNSAFLNISTSAQLAFVLPSGFQPQEYKDLDSSNFCKSIEFFPYFTGRYIAVAAALTGGNSLASYVGMLHSWMEDLGVDIDRKTLWSKFLAAGTVQRKTDLVVEPTLLGERCDPDKKGSMSNAHPGNLTLGHFSRAVCKGIISNIAQLMPQDFLIQFGIQTIYGAGSALHRNPIFQEEMVNIFDKMNIQLCNSGDSAVGAAAVGKKLL